MINTFSLPAFTKLRKFLTSEGSLSEKVDELGRNTNQLFKIVFERLDYIDSIIKEEPLIKKTKIGFKN